MSDDRTRDDAGTPVSASASRATAADVARRAGVSRATVSYVLNNTANQRISDATRELVLRSAAELGHFPDANARALRAGRSHIVMGLVPGYTIGLLFELLLDHLDVELSRLGFGLVVHRHSTEGLTISQLWGLVNPEIVVVFGGLSDAEIESFRKSPARVVRIDQMLSDVAVGRLQAEYLIQKGHTRLGFGAPSDPTLAVFAAGRLEGIAQVCAEHGLEPPETREIPLRPAQAIPAIESWRAAGVTGVAAHNDDHALVLLGAFRLVGEERPIAVIGADDLPVAEIGLTTVSFDSEAISRQLNAAVVAALQGEPLPDVELAALSVVVRESA
jgi:DNA-binding LacI/PurR family transcriptional regulator